MEINTFVKKEKINAFNGLHLDDFLTSPSSCCVKVLDFHKDLKVFDYINSCVPCDKKRILDSLKLVLLPTSILDKKMSVLSTTESLKISLAVLLIKNVSTLVFYQFDFYFMEKELAYFKKLFKKIVQKYHKTIVLLDSRITFMMDLVDRFVVCNEKKELEVFITPTFYEERLLELLGTPLLVDFVRYLNQNGHKFLPYRDIKELIKAIYREV